MKVDTIYDQSELRMCSYVKQKRSRMCSHHLAEIVYIEIEFLNSDTSVLVTA